MGSRRIAGFALGEHHDAGLAYGALAMAVAVRGGDGPAWCSTPVRAASTRRVPSGRRASGWASRSRWAGRARRWTTRSSSPGTPPWSSSCGRCARSRPGQQRAQRSRRGSRTTTTSGGTPPSAWSARGLRACPGGKGRRVSAAGPLRGPGKGGGCAAAVLAAPAKRTGPPPRPPGCCASPCGRRLAGRPGPRRPLRPLGAGKAGRPQPAPARRGRSKDSPPWP
jgi:hypothetical protein